MHKVFYLTLILFLTQTVKSQTTDTVYFKDNLHNKASIEDYTISGIRNYGEKGKGITTYFRKDGSAYATFNEKKGKRTGEGTFYHENGVISRSGSFKKDRQIGVHDYFDITAVYIRSEVYNARGKIIAEYYKTASGKKVYTICDRLSSFGKSKKETKAFAQMGVFIDENLIHPPIAKDLDEAIVTVAFLIAPDGSIEELEIVQSIHPALNDEVIAVMKKMPNWRPAKFKGTAVYSEFSITVNF